MLRPETKEDRPWRKQGWWQSNSTNLHQDQSSFWSIVDDVAIGVSSASGPVRVLREESVTVNEHVEQDTENEPNQDTEEGETRVTQGHVVDTSEDDWVGLEEAEKNSKHKGNVDGEHHNDRLDKNLQLQASLDGSLPQKNRLVGFRTKHHWNQNQPSKDQVDVHWPFPTFSLSGISRDDRPKNRTHEWRQTETRHGNTHHFVVPHVGNSPTSNSHSWGGEEPGKESQHQYGANVLREHNPHGEEHGDGQGQDVHDTTASNLRDWRSQGWTKR
ncbi:hypothetical protein WICPIJ_008244 [Wickerhamomyces pijperi]|uniref:Uncharacterized protein n=1 Tax=Wickerhamomyces pijperi TaxID=599730 RepID=A0A9P8TI92_WICPI|nr:hypothetical protein WICPIJ_008244 [Wickerhamomyces pijperi]